MILLENLMRVSSDMMERVDLETDSVVKNSETDANWPQPIISKMSLAMLSSYVLSVSTHLDNVRQAHLALCMDRQDRLQAVVNRK